MTAVLILAAGMAAYGATVSVWRLGAEIFQKLENKEWWR